MKTGGGGRSGKPSSSDYNSCQGPEIGIKLA